MPSKLDSIDLRILRLLQGDGKMKIKDIAGNLEMSNTPVYERIKRMEREGFIKGYSTQIDREKLGFNIVAFVSITLDKHSTDALNVFKEQIEDMDEILECYYIAGLFDFLLKIVVQDMNTYQDFITQRLASIDVVGKVQSSFVMSEIKYNHLLSPKASE